VQSIESVPTEPLCNMLTAASPTLAEAARFQGRTTRAICLFVLAAGVSAWVQTSQDARPGCVGPPQLFPAMTFDEDNRYLSNADCRTEFWDRLKFIPLDGENLDYYLSLGAAIRDRSEYFSNPTWATKPPGSAYLMQRYYLHIDLHLSDWFRFFSELGSSLETGRTGGPRANIDESKLYVHQGFVDIGLLRDGKNRLTLRAGRQELAFGSLVSTRDGRNIRTSFDGFRLTALTGDWRIDTFAVKESAFDPGIFDAWLDHTTSFWGVYAVRPIGLLPGGHADIYYMGLDNKKETYVAGTGREQRETFGTRLWGSGEAWDYNDEFVIQRGRFGSGDIRAWAVATQTGYRFDSVPLQPRFAVRADAYSGDQNPSGHTLGTFNALNEVGPYFSYAELFGRRNLIVVQPSVRLNLRKNISLSPNGAFYWRESTQDGLYSIASGTIVVPGQKSKAEYVGSHAAVQLKWDVNRHTSFFTEYLHFFPGEFLRQSTPGRNINYVTEWVEFRY
jgi:hypothetical protein